MSLLKLFFLMGFLFSVISCFQPEKNKTSDQVSALSTIDKFYKNLLINPIEAKELKFSKSFQDVADLNKKLCSKKQNIKCGFDGNIYLNAQDYSPNLTYENSRMKLREPEKGTVIATFNIFPGEGSHHSREITYQMVIEDNQWVVNDMLTGGKSSRNYLQKENLQLAN